MKHLYAGIVLAAGKSERFGSPKIFAVWHGQPLLRHVVELVLRQGFAQVIVVLGAEAQKAISVLQGLSVTAIVNENYDHGIGTSFSAGISAIEKSLDGAFVFLADQPQINSSLITTMIVQSAAYDVVYPTYHNQPGHPVLWKSTTFDRIRHLKPGETGNGIKVEYRCREIPWNSTTIVDDIDTPQAYKYLLSHNKKE